MPVSVVVGGQFGSEGKGKVALFLADSQSAKAVVRIGGTNSGHTVVVGGRRQVFRQLPVAAVVPSVKLVLAAGTYIDIDVLIEEVRRAGIGPERLVVDPRAVVITAEHQQAERVRRLRERIGSTLSGTGEAVRDRISRRPDLPVASAFPQLGPFIGDTKRLLNELHDDGERIVIEGTQGYGLSLLHSPYGRYATSRDTTAAGFVSEVGLSPLIVDTVALVIRAFPIRVPGASGPLPHEIDWGTVRAESGAAESLEEFTSVTGRVRRVARFDAEIVKLAMQANRPNLIFLNHLDHEDARVRSGHLSATGGDALQRIESQIGRAVTYWGFSPAGLSARDEGFSWRGPVSLGRDVA